MLKRLVKSLENLAQGLAMLDSQPARYQQAMRYQHVMEVVDCMDWSETTTAYDA